VRPGTGNVVHTAIVRAPIDTTALLARVGAPEHGAALLFLGTVRDHNDGRPVEGVGYEAYEEMAAGVLAAVAQEAAAQLGVGSIAVEHRVGELAVGEVSVAIAVAAPHRAPAYAASRYIIEEIKKRLPVWKQERYVDGEARWLPGNQPEPSAQKPEPRQPAASGKERRP
jgi:molybdopterin synthase catalytic subunit